MIRPVVGVDHDSYGWYAVCLGPGHVTPWASSWGTAGGHDERRIRACREFREFLGRLPAGTFVCVEEPLALPKNGKTTRILCLMGGALWAQHLDMDLMWYWVDNMSWKKNIVGRGNVRKEDTITYVRSLNFAGEASPEERLAAYDMQPNLFDAHAIAMYARRIAPTLGEAAG